MNNKNTKRILLTRSESDNLLLERALKQRYFVEDRSAGDAIDSDGFDGVDNLEILNLDLIAFKDVDFDYNKFHEYDNIIVTSKYAASLMPDNIYNHNAYVVGKTSADILLNKGYNIKHLAETAYKLCDVVELELKNNPLKRFVYFSGDHITVEMSPIRKIIYRVEYKQDLTAAEISFIKSGVDIIPVYSTNCARALIKLLKSHNLMKYVVKSRIIAISSNVAHILKYELSNKDNDEDNNNNRGCYNIIVAESSSKMMDAINANLA